MKNRKAKNWFSKVKNRLHFDAKVSKKKAMGIVKKENVITHAFFPFIYFEIKQFKLAKKNLRLEQGIELDPYKIRKIFYSCHSDSYIFSYYNELLLRKYEELINSEGLDCCIAYRHIDKNSKGIGKSNIDFAAEAFKEIERRKICYVVGLDIQKFFDNLDWDILKNNLCKILNVERLPDDWFQIYKILTKYHYITLDDILHCKYIKSNRRAFWNNDTHSFDKICSAKTFRRIIKEYPELIKKNELECGIPQGTNISGTLANIYMLDFDIEIQQLLKHLQGYYRRYSDDILIIVNTKDDLEKILKIIKIKLENLKLKLSDDKTLCCKFIDNECLFEPCELKQNVYGYGVFQYLGFTYNGEKILMRDSTLIRFWKDAIKHTRSMVLNNFYNNRKIPIKKIYGLYTHLKNEKSEYGNFYKYARKAQRIFEEDFNFGRKVGIKKQLSKSWNILHEFLYRLKVKHHIPDEMLKIPRDINLS